MKGRYLLAPEAALDLVQIWRYIKKHVGLEMADRVEAVIREKIAYLARKPLHVVAILHGNRDLEHFLKDRS